MSTPHVYVNLMLTFVLGGLWHGATWMFVIWGALHGCALAAHRLWKGWGRTLPPALAWLVTFAFVNVAWVFFRAKTMDDALRVLHGMVDVASIRSLTAATVPTADLAWAGWLADVMLRWLPASLVGQVPACLAIAAAFVITGRRNSLEISAGTPGTAQLAAGALLFSVAMVFTLAATSSVFLYFNF